MSAGEDSETVELLRRAQAGDNAAIRQLLERHRERLRHMLKVRLDPRLRSRLDASDIIQETMLEASNKLPDYLVSRPLPFYPWLRQIAYCRLVDQHRRHVEAAKRSVEREEQWLPLPDHSAAMLAAHCTTGSREDR